MKEAINNAKTEEDQDEKELKELKEQLKKK